MKHLRPFQSCICLLIGVWFIEICLLSLFWWWSALARDQVHDLSRSTHINLLVYYGVMDFLLLAVLSLATAMYLDEVRKWKVAHWLKSQHIESIDDTLLDHYRLLVFVEMNRMIMDRTLRSCIHDEWLCHSILLFCCGDQSVNVLRDRRILRALEQHLATITVVDGEGNRERNDEVPSDSESEEIEEDSLRNFAEMFNKKLVDARTYIGEKTEGDIRSLVVVYLRYC